MVPNKRHDRHEPRPTYFAQISAARRKRRLKAIVVSAAVLLGAAGVGLAVGGGSAFADAVAKRVGAATGDCLLLSVHDGDTIRCGTERIRIENIDAPELAGSPKCEDRRKSYAWCDYALGEQSRDALSDFLRSGPIKVERNGTDKYGRTLARLTVDGRDAGEYLIGLGLAKAW